MFLKIYSITEPMTHNPHNYVSLKILNANGKLKYQDHIFLCYNFSRNEASVNSKPLLVRLKQAWKEVRDSE